MMYGMIHLCNLKVRSCIYPIETLLVCVCHINMLLVFVLKERLTMTDMCILVTAAVCHDLDHPGYNNTYVSLSENNATDNTVYFANCKKKTFWILVN